MIEPYYSEDGITIFREDCRVIMPQVHSDCILTDPPYGVGMNNYVDNFESVQYLHNAPSGIMACFTSPARVGKLLTILRENWKFERLLWMHKTADISFPWHGWMMNGEAICILSKYPSQWPKVVEKFSSDTYTVGPWERTGHPSSKPIAVIKDIMSKISSPGQTVLDPFMGSGTTLLAAKQLGRRAIGIEISEKYCEIAVKRLAQTQLDFKQ